MRSYILIFLITFVYSVSSQTVVNLNSLKLLSKTDNIYIRSLFNDSLASSFCIVVKIEVKTANTNIIASMFL